MFNGQVNASSGAENGGREGLGADRGGFRTKQRNVRRRRLREVPEGE